MIQIISYWKLKNTKNLKLLLTHSQDLSLEYTLKSYDYEQQ